MLYGDGFVGIVATLGLLIFGILFGAWFMIALVGAVIKEWQQERRADRYVKRIMGK